MALPELAVMKQAHKLLRKLNRPAQQRVLTWLRASLKGKGKDVAPAGEQTPVTATTASADAGDDRGTMVPDTTATESVSVTQTAAAGPQDTAAASPQDTVAAGPEAAGPAPKATGDAPGANADEAPAAPDTPQQPAPRRRVARKAPAAKVTPTQAAPETAVKAAPETAVKAARSSAAKKATPTRTAGGVAAKKPAQTVSSAAPAPAVRRGMPPAEEIMAVYKEVGTLKGVAEHYNKSSATMTTWASILRDQGYEIGRSRKS